MRLCHLYCAIELTCPLSDGSDCTRESLQHMPRERTISFGFNDKGLSPVSTVYPRCVALECMLLNRQTEWYSSTTRLSLAVSNRKATNESFFYNCFRYKNQTLLPLQQLSMRHVCRCRPLWFQDAFQPR